MFQKRGLLLVYDAGLMSQHPAVLPASSFTPLFIQFSGYTLSYLSPPKKAGLLFLFAFVCFFPPFFRVRYRSAGSMI